MTPPSKYDLHLLKLENDYLSHKSDSFTLDIDFIKYFFRSNSFLLENPNIFSNFITPEVAKDVDLITIALSYDPYVLELASDDIKNNREVVEKTISSAGFTLQYASPILQNDKSLVLLAVQKDGRAFEFASETLRNDREVAYAAIQSNGSALKFVSPQLTEDNELCSMAVEFNALCLQYTNFSFKDNEQNVLNAIKNNSEVFGFASERLRNNRETVLAAISQHGHLLQYAGLEFKNTKDLAMTALETSKEGHIPNLVKSLSLELRNDKDVIFKAANKNVGALEHASPEIKAERSFMLSLVKNHPYCFNYMNNELKNDKELIDIALSQPNPTGSPNDVLKSLSDDFKDDKEIVKKAVQQSGMVLRHASTRLRNDKEFVLELIKINKDAKFGIGEDLQEEIGKNDPQKYLESYFLYQKIQNIVPNKIEVNNKKKI